MPLVIEKLVSEEKPIFVRMKQWISNLTIWQEYIFSNQLGQHEIVNVTIITLIIWQSNNGEMHAYLSFRNKKLNNWQLGVPRRMNENMFTILH